MHRPQQRRGEWNCQHNGDEIESRSVPREEIPCIKLELELHVRRITEGISNVTIGESQIL